MELAKLGTGVNAKLVGDGGARLTVDLQRLCMPASAVEGRHQQQPQGLLQRVVGEQPAELGNGLDVPAAGELGGDAELDGVQAQLGEPVRLGFDQRGGGDIGQRLTAPEAERLGEGLRRALRIASGKGAPAVPYHRLEQLGVGIGWRQLELVAGGPGDQQAAVGLAEEPAQPQHVDADQVGRRLGRRVPPHLADKEVGRHNLPSVDQQGCQDRTPLRGSDPLPVFSGPDLKRSEQPEPHHSQGSRLRQRRAVRRFHLIMTQWGRKPPPQVCRVSPRQRSPRASASRGGRQRGRRPTRRPSKRPLA